MSTIAIIVGLILLLSIFATVASAILAFAGFFAFKFVAIPFAILAGIWICAAIVFGD